MVVLNPGKGSVGHFRGVSSPSTPYHETILAETGLVSYWRLPGVTDSADANNATAAGNPVTTTALVVGGDGALTFDAIDDQLSVPDAANLKPAAITLEAWVIKDATIANYSGLVMKTTSGAWSDGYGLTYITSSEAGSGPNGGPSLRWWFNAYNTAGTFVDATLPPTTTQHVVATYDGANMRMYINGTEAAHSPVARVAAISHSTAALLIGSAPGGARWKGKMDEVAVYNTALSAAQVAAHYSKGASG